MKCKICGTELVKGIEVCHNCGCVNSRPSGKKIALTTVIVVLVIAISFTMLFLFSGKNDLYLMTDGEYLGYIDKTGEWVIEPLFEEAGNFHDGLAYAYDSETGLYGYIDKTGEWAIEPQFWSAGDFSEGYAVVTKENWEYFYSLNINMMAKENATQQQLYGYIDTKGNVVIEPKFIEAENFANGYAWVTEVEDVKLGEVMYCENTLEEYIYDDDGQLIIPQNVTYINNQCKDKHIDKSGEDADPGYHENVTTLSDNRCLFYDEYEDAYGYYDKDGNVVIPPKFFEAEPFSDGLALICDMETGLYGFIDTEGNYVIEPEYEGALSFVDGAGIVLVYDNDRNGETIRYIDTQGKTIVEKYVEY